MPANFGASSQNSLQGPWNDLISVTFPDCGSAGITMITFGDMPFLPSRNTGPQKSMLSSEKRHSFRFNAVPAIDGSSSTVRRRSKCSSTDVTLTALCRYTTTDIYWTVDSIF